MKNPRARRGHEGEGENVPPYSWGFQISANTLSSSWPAALPRFAKSLLDPNSGAAIESATYSLPEADPCESIRRRSRCLGHHPIIGLVRRFVQDQQKCDLGADRESSELALKAAILALRDRSDGSQVTGSFCCPARDLPPACRTQRPAGARGTTRL